MRFGDFVAVDHVTFRIARGEIFGFLGSNGCGKTTTMKMLTGLLPASEGRAWLFGQPVDATDIETRRRVGYMTQSFSLYTELTVRQNLLLHAQLFSVPAERIDGACRGDGATVRSRRHHGHPPGLPAARPAATPPAGGGNDPRAGAPDPRRADLGRRPGGARRLLAHSRGAVAPRRGHDLRLHALHERGGALRPHLAHARRPCAGERRAGGVDREARARRPWKRRSSPISRTPRRRCTSRRPHWSRSRPAVPRWCPIAGTPGEGSSTSAAC